MTRLLVSVGAAALSLAGAVFAGEVKGPPQDPNGEWQESTNYTAAPDHARSICAFSGLNDFHDEGPLSVQNHTQTAADSFKLYGLPKGVVGQACRGTPSL
jgi:hypothetical protein